MWHFPSQHLHCLWFRHLSAAAAGMCSISACTLSFFEVPTCLNFALFFPFLSFHHMFLRSCDQQWVDDHTHMPTLEAMPRDLPMIAQPEAAERIRPLGFKSLTTISPGQTMQLCGGKLQLRATAGALVGPPWSARQNGYALRVRGAGWQGCCSSAQHHSIRTIGCESSQMYARLAVIGVEGWVVRCCAVQCYCCCDHGDACLCGNCSK